MIKCSSYRQAQWWSHEIRSLSERSNFYKMHRFEGFAPPRPDTLTKWSVHLRNAFFQRILMYGLVCAMKLVLSK